MLRGGGEQVLLKIDGVFAQKSAQIQDIPGAHLSWQIPSYTYRSLERSFTRGDAIVGRSQGFQK